MNHRGNNMLKNNIILLMGIAGTGKNTIGKAITKQDNHFKLAHHHTWLDPILKLLGDNDQVWWSLDEKGWCAINQAHDLILNTIADVCPKDSSFIITAELLANNPFHGEYFNKVLEAAKRRSATLTPVRLICELDELLNRVLDNERLAYFKTRDGALIKKRFVEEDVFYSQLPNELTLDVTHLSPELSAIKILEWVASTQNDTQREAIKR